MKIYSGVFVLFSVVLSAQTVLRKPLKLDSAKFPKIEKQALDLPTDNTKSDSTLAKLYKMPVSKPKNPQFYSSLRAPKRDTTLYKIPNLLETDQPPKLTTK